MNIARQIDSLLLSFIFIFTLLFNNKKQTKKLFYSIILFEIDIKTFFYMHFDVNRCRVE